jgi:hypothetical protein
MIFLDKLLSEESIEMALEDVTLRSDRRHRAAEIQEIIST